MTMPKNLQRWEWQTNEKGERVRVAIPFDCACGQPSHYGKNNRWLCTFCWQREHAFAETVVTL